jgi:cytochrome c
MRRLLLCALLLAACNREDKQQISNMTGGDASKGKEAIARYGCTACHNVPGVKGPRGMVGPPLDHMASRAFIAGKIQNTPPNMIQWIENPQSMDPNNAMPNLNVTAADAKDMAAFLYTLK